jgi:8-oxo-dGTP diphosphatase
MAYTYRYPRPAVAVDIVVLRRPEGRALSQTEILLIRRGRAPFRGKWALPGGFVEMDEDLPDAARRELREETGLAATRLVELGAFGRPGRDPRGRVISVVFVATVPLSKSRARAADDAAEAAWFSLDSPPPLAFDHAEILARARGRLAARPGPAREGSSRVPRTKNTKKRKTQEKKTKKKRPARRR